MSENTYTKTLLSEQETHACAAKMFEVIMMEHPRVVIFLQGDLGVGKTTFVRGFLRAAGYNGQVKSPTYTLIEPYHLKDMDIYHLDLYRLTGPNDLEEIGLRDIVDDPAYFLIEWPMKAAGGLFVSDVELNITIDGPQRVLSMRPNSQLGHDIVQAFCKK